MNDDTRKECQRARSIATKLTRDEHSDRWECAYAGALAAFDEMGMSARDWFAIHASEEDVGAHMFENSDDWAERPRSREQARYAFADAMLEARGQSTAKAPSRA